MNGPYRQRIDNVTLGDRREIRSNPMVRYCRGELVPTIDTLALEAPLDIYLDGEHAGRTMRTPGADRDLAAGMLFTSGRLALPGDAARLCYKTSRDAVRVFSDRAAVRSPEDAPLAPPDNRVEPATTARAELAEQLLEMRAVLEDTQRWYRHTGATHCAMFFDRSGEAVSFGEDVGRHNAFDKCVGRALLEGGHNRACHALVSSRLSHEIVSKAVRTGISVLAGFSVATSIALELAERHGIVLVGRLRKDTMNFYTSGE